MASALAPLVSPKGANFLGFPHSVDAHLGSGSFSPSPQGDYLEVWGRSGRDRSGQERDGRRSHERSQDLEVGKDIETLRDETGEQPVEEMDVARGRERFPQKDWRDKV